MEKRLKRETCIDIVIKNEMKLLSLQYRNRLKKVEWIYKPEN